MKVYMTPQNAGEALIADCEIELLTKQPGMLGDDFVKVTPLECSFFRSGIEYEKLKPVVPRS
jgi:hypothetical protein